MAMVKVRKHATMTREQVQAEIKSTCANIYRLIEERGFPAPIRKGFADPLWDYEAVLKWKEMEGGLNGL